MKKLISSLLVLTMVLALSSVNVFAIGSITLGVTGGTTTVSEGDIIEVVATADTTVGIAAYTIGIKYDTSVFEIVNSEAYEAYAADPNNQAVLNEAIAFDPSYTMERLYTEEKTNDPRVGDTYLTFWSGSNKDKFPGTAAQMFDAGEPSFGSVGTTAIGFGNRLANAPMLAIRLKVVDGAAAGTTTIKSFAPVAGVNTDGKAAYNNGSADSYLDVAPLTLTVEGASQPANEYTLTTNVASDIDLDVTVDGVAWDGSSKITEGASVAITAALTTNNVKTKIASVTVGGTDTAIGANGGTYTFEMAADTAIVATTGEVEAADVKTVNIHYTDDETDTTYFFGKANTAAAEFGIEIEGYTLSANASVANKGPKFPAINAASAQGFYGIGIIGLEAGTYNVKAYSDAVYGTVYSATVAE